MPSHQQRYCIGAEVGGEAHWELLRAALGGCVPGHVSIWTICPHRARGKFSGNEKAPPERGNLGEIPKSYFISALLILTLPHPFSSTLVWIPVGGGVIVHVAFKVLDTLPTESTTRNLQFQLPTGMVVGNVPAAAIVPDVKPLVPASCVETVFPTFPLASKNSTIIAVTSLPESMKSNVQVTVAAPPPDPCGTDDGEVKLKFEMPGGCGVGAGGVGLLPPPPQASPKNKSPMMAKYFIPPPPRHPAESMRFLPPVYAEGSPRRGYLRSGRSWRQ